MIAESKRSSNYVRSYMNRLNCVNLHNSIVNWW